MFSSIKSNNLINKVHERSLRIVSGDNHSSFKSLLSKCDEITIHQRNLQVLITETDCTRLLTVYLHQLSETFLYYEKIRTTCENFKKYLMKIGKQ